MSAKPLLFAGPHACWQQRLSRERHAAYNFHDTDQFQGHDQVYPDYLSKIDKKMVRSWRQNHPKRYHPPSIASHATARTTRSLVPTQAGRAIRDAGQNLAQSPTAANARSGSLINQPVHSMAQTFTQGFQPVHRMAQKRHGQKTIEDLLAENEAYDHAIRTLNNKRDGVLAQTVGKENRKGREAIAKYMGASSGPFAIIGEPSNPEAASPFQLKPQAFVSKPHNHHIPLPFEKFYSRAPQQDGVSVVSRKSGANDGSSQIPKRHRSQRPHDKESTVDTQRAMSEFSMRSQVRRAIGKEVNMDLSDENALSSTAKHLLKQLSVQLEKEKLEGTRLKERLRELKRSSNDKDIQEFFTHVY